MRTRAARATRARTPLAAAQSTTGPGSSARHSHIARVPGGATELSGARGGSRSGVAAIRATAARSTHSTIWAAESNARRMPVPSAGGPGS
ncbi:hypothetical protein ACPPVO_13315 [Dactylosporangium sp. McL0621]|uniref:hypothetical protein n=1 Tax=Dactylosporangium sp. McL0621 TaxID=3415678 RepID=UPI003CF26D55